MASPHEILFFAGMGRFAAAVSPRFGPERAVLRAFAPAGYDHSGKRVKRLESRLNAIATGLIYNFHNPSSFSRVGQ